VRRSTPRIIVPSTSRSERARPPYLSTVLSARICLSGIPPSRIAHKVTGRLYVNHDIIGIVISNPPLEVPGPTGTRNRRSRVPPDRFWPTPVTWPLNLHLRHLSHNAYSLVHPVPQNAEIGLFRICTFYVLEYDKTAHSPLVPVSYSPG